MSEACMMDCTHDSMICMRYNLRSNFSISSVRSTLSQDQEAKVFEKYEDSRGSKNNMELKLKNISVQISPLRINKHKYCLSYYL